MVYVQDINGKPMMPTTRHGKVRRLLKDKKAVVVNLCPFTIRLTYVTSDYKQEIVLGVDAGTKHVGLSATTKSKELYSSEVILRAVMGIMKWRLYEELKSKYDNISMTFGYVTKYNRIKHGIEKSHVSDAFVISKNFNAIRLGYYYKVRLVRRHNRQIHKQKIPKGGVKRLNQSPFEVFGFRLFDRVMFENSYYFIFGRRKTGRFNIRDIDGKNQRDITYKKLKLSRCKCFMVQNEMN